MNSTPPADPISTVRACLFVLGGAVFGIDLRWARGVVVLDDLTLVPCAPSHLSGVAHFRGQILPVLEIRPLLGLPSRAVARGTRALVMEAGPLQAAVATERVLGLASFQEIQPLAGAFARPSAAFEVGLVSGENGPATLLDAPRILEALRIGAPGVTGSGGAEHAAISAREGG